MKLKYSVPLLALAGVLLWAQAALGCQLGGTPFTKFDATEYVFAGDVVGVHIAPSELMATRGEWSFDR